MADLVEDIRKQIDARLAELRPLVQEAANLAAALSALAGADGQSSGTASRRRTRKRPPTPRASGVRPRGQSREQIIEYVRAHSGSTAGEVASALGLKRTSVSTRLAQLAKAGELTKAERGYRLPG
jgi:DNA-binding transcriptional ArsR family regulator